MSRSIILVITRGDVFAGAQKYVLLQAEGLIKQGYKVLVVYGGSSQVLSKRLDAKGIEYKIIKSLCNDFNIYKDIKAFNKLLKLVKEFNASFLFLNSTKSVMLFRAITVFSSVKVVAVIHGLPFGTNEKPLRRVVYSIFELLTSMLISKYIVVSKYDSAILSRIVRVTKKIAVIYNGVDESKGVRVFNENSQVLRILMVARFDEQKNQTMLIDACKDISEVDLIFLGDGPMMQSVRNYVRQNTPKCKVFFEGFQSKVEDYYLSSDVFVLTSNWEGFPYSTIEAMSFGLPVIVTDVGGAAEPVAHTINGFVVQKDGTEELTSAINYVLRNRSSLSELGRNSLKIFRQNFTVDRMIKQTVNQIIEVNE